MLFLQVFIRISIQFGGFSEPHQGSSREIPRKSFHILRAKPQILRVLKLQYDVNKVFCVCQSGKQIRITGIFLDGKGFFARKLLQTVILLSS